MRDPNADLTSHAATSTWPSVSSTRRLPSSSPSVAAPAPARPPRSSSGPGPGRSSPGCGDPAQRRLPQGPVRPRPPDRLPHEAYAPDVSPRLCHHRRPCRHLPRRRPLGDRTPSTAIPPSAPPSPPSRPPSASPSVASGSRPPCHRCRPRHPPHRRRLRCRRHRPPPGREHRLHPRHLAPHRHRTPVEAVAAEVLATLNPDPDR